MNNNQTGLNVKIEAINNELTYIFNNLEKNPETIKNFLQINEDDKIFNAELEPITNIVIPAFTTDNVQIKYYDLENREYTNVYKINNLYGGLYDIDKREPINDNSYEIFKLNKNISYSIDFNIFK